MTRFDLDGTSRSSPAAHAASARTSPRRWPSAEPGSPWWRAVSRSLTPSPARCARTAARSWRSPRTSPRPRTGTASSKPPNAVLGPIGCWSTTPAATRSGNSTTSPSTDIEAVLELNLTSAVILARLVLPGMLDPQARAHRERLLDGRARLLPVHRGLRRGQGRTDRIHPRAARRLPSPRRDRLDADPRPGPRHRCRSRAPPSRWASSRRPIGVTGAAVGKATVRAIRKDKAELAVLPGPGRTLRAVLDRFPALGPVINRATGIDKTMQTIADHREREALTNHHAA